MGRIFGMLFIVLAIWAAVEVFTNGTEGAFGGLFASGSPSAESAPAKPAGDRAADALKNLYDKSEGRAEKAFGE